MRDENGLEKCVACGLCAVACPADAIYLEAAENDGTRPGRPALREGLPDPQDALHLLRLLRRGLPGVGDLHGQGLRARRLQQQGLHLGQAGPPGPGERSRQLQIGELRGFVRRFTDRRSSDSPIAVRRPRRHPRRLRERPPGHGAASGRSVLALRRRRRRTTKAGTNRSRRRCTGSRATTRIRRHRGRRLPRRTSSTSRTACAGRRRPARRRAGRHVCADVGIDTPAAELPHPRKGDGAAATGARRQAAALRARGSGGVQGAERASTCS